MIIRISILPHGSLLAVYGEQRQIEYMFDSMLKRLYKKEKQNKNKNTCFLSNADKEFRRNPQNQWSSESPI